MPDDENTFARPRVAAGVLFRDAEGRILLVKPTYKDGWEIPGGYVSAGESPKTAASRELKEELSVSWKIGALLAVDWAPSQLEGDKLLFVFDGGVLSADWAQSFRVDGAEIEAAAVHHVRDLEELVPPRLANRLRTCLQLTEPAYLEHGSWF
jgi:ADP-ribose pyrophosphatase YjhB (NUDIX family)